MDLRFAPTPPHETDADLLAVLVDDPSTLPAALTQLDELLGGALTRELARGQVKADQASLVTVTGAATGPARIALVGFGPESDGRGDALRVAGARIAGAARASEAGSIAVVGRGDAAEQQALVEGLELGAFRTFRYRSADADVTPAEPADDAATGRYAGPATLTLLGDEPGALREAARTGHVLATAQNWARDLANAPANHLTPTKLAETASELAQAHSELSFRELDRAGIEAAGMGMFAAVAQGAHDEPRLIVLEWNPAGANEADDARLALVGKAVTFDTGGISIKPTSGMEGMKLDKAGGCAVLGAMRAIARLGLQRRVLAVIGATMNMPDGNAYRPGDVLTAKDGTTVEVISTDAEGRLVLGDCISYARELGCGAIVEASTLTGAMVIALGHRFTGAIATPDSPLIGTVLDAAAATGDHAWHLPIHAEYTRNLKTDCADFRNSGARDAGSLSAGGFLQHFAQETPFVHLDVAGTGMLPRPRLWYGCKGASGAGMRLMVEVARRHGA